MIKRSLNIMNQRSKIGHRNRKSTIIEYFSEFFYDQNIPLDIFTFKVELNYSNLK